MNTSLRGLSPEKQQRLFEEFAKEMRRLSSFEISPQERRLDNLAIGLTPAESKRHQEGDDCLSFVIVFPSCYAIEVFPRFDTQTKSFTKTGQGTIQIKNLITQERLVGIYFKKWDGMLSRMLDLAKFFNAVLRNHPRGESGQKMTIVEVGKWSFAFVDPSNPKKGKISLLDPRFLDLVPGIRNSVEAIFENRDNYWHSKPKGSKKLSDLVKRRTAKHPSMGIPLKGKKQEKKELVEN